MQLFGSAHPVEVEQLLTHDCITEENLVELSKLEEEHFLEVVYFELPVLCHSRSETLPLVWWDEKSCLVVVWIIGSSAILVFDVFCLEE